MRQQRARWVVLAVLAAAPVVAGPVTGRAGSYGVTLTMTPDPPLVGANSAVVQLTDRHRRPVSGATVTITARMLEMQMPAVDSPATAGANAGEYRAPVNLTMAGRWSLEVKVSAAAGAGQTSFPLTTGNQMHRASAGGIRRVWVWLLLMICAPLLVALVPERFLRRDRRTTVAGALALVAAFFLANTVVTTFRKPGQMSVVEAQAMDMGAMKPPVGTVPVVTEAVQAASFTGGVSYTGSVVPYAQQDVYPRVTGQIVDMPVYPGDKVRRGQLLARLDTRELGSRRDEAVLAHLAAQDAAGAARQEQRSAAAGLEQARAEQAAAGHRITQMAADKAAAEVMVQRSKHELAAAQARVRQAESQVAAAKAAQRTRAAMSAESRAMVQGAEADRGTGGGMVTQATEELSAARREVTEAAQMADAARAGQDSAHAAAAAARTELAQAQADLSAMQADLTFAEQELARVGKLLKQGAVSQEEYDSQKSTRDQAAARVRRAQAMVSGAGERIRSAEAMARQSAAEAAAAGERQAKAEAMVRAAEAKLAQAKSDLSSRQAMVSQRQAGVQSRAAEQDEADSMLAMRLAEVDTAKADVASATAAVEQAVQEVARRAAALAEARSERDKAAGMVRERTAMQAAASQRAGEMARRADQARAAAFTASTVAGYTEIRSDLDGVVTERVTSPATLVQPGMVLLRIAQIDQVRLQANVAEQDAAAVRPGSPVQILPRKGPDRVDTTVVSAVFPATNPTSRTVIVEALADNRDHYYLPGDFITLRIADSQHSKLVLSVPAAAVVQMTAPGGGVIGESRPAVWVAAGGGATKTVYTCPMHPEVVSDQPGKCPKCGMDLVAKQEPGQAQAQTKTEYTCPMHPEVLSDKPGACPKCGMDLVPKTVATGSGNEVAHEVPVTLGRRNADRVEVLSGLSPGDQVIVQGFNDLREGDRLKVTAGPPPAPTLSGSDAGGKAPSAPKGKDRTPHGPPMQMGSSAGDLTPQPPVRTLSAPKVQKRGGAAAPPVRGDSPAPRAERRPRGEVPRQEPTKPAAATPKTRYICPMCPGVVSDKPDKCPKCGMDLVPEKGH